MKTRRTAGAVRAHRTLDRRTLLLSVAGAAGAASVPATGAAAQTAASPGPWEARGTVPRAGGAIGYATAGAGARTTSTLVLLPKLGGWIDDWAPLARELAGEYRLVAIDPPGHGASRMQGEPPPVQTVSESAAMVRGALEALDIESFVAVGNSLGGAIAATLAARWPEAVSHLVLVSTAIFPRDPLAKIVADEALMDPPAYDADGNALPRSAATAMSRFGMDAAFVDAMIRSRAAAGRWIRASERGVRREGLVDLLPRVAAPTLLVYSDKGTYVRHVATAQRLLPRARLATIPGGGSFVHQEKPAETARAIREFLRGA